MLISNRLPRQRRGATVVEFSIVCVILFLFLFGIFEYCRYLFILDITTNAARDAARYAAVHTNGPTMPGDPSSITTSNLTNLVTTGTIGTLTVGPGMAGMQGNLSSYNVQIFAADPNGLAQKPPVVIPNQSNGGAWNTAAYEQPIAVVVTGNYQPFLPTLLFLPASIPVQVTVMVSSEAN
jgi:Flp pilus assembly protein TadG